VTRKDRIHRAAEGKETLVAFIPTFDLIIGWFCVSRRKKEKGAGVGAIIIQTML
jgi:hypothetical protein